MRLADLFGAHRAAQMREYLRTFAASFGIPDMESPERLPNTRRALAVAELARDEGALDAWRHAAMDAYWRDGRDLEDPATLAGLAWSVGIDAEAARQVMDDPSYRARVDAIRREAGAAGVTGIPTFVFGPSSSARVVGCQPYPVLAAGAERAGARRR